MSSPELGPWLLPFLDAESQEHDRVKDCPGAVGEVSGDLISMPEAGKDGAYLYLLTACKTPCSNEDYVECTLRSPSAPQN